MFHPPGYVICNYEISLLSWCWFIILTTASKTINDTLKVRWFLKIVRLIFFLKVNPLLFIIYIIIFYKINEN